MYFELARWWGGGALDHVMSLSFSQMVLYTHQAHEIANDEARRAKKT
jgi:hypothetical protein